MEENTIPKVEKKEGALKEKTISYRLVKITFPSGKESFRLMSAKNEEEFKLKFDVNFGNKSRRGYTYEMLDTL